MKKLILILSFAVAITSCGDANKHYVNGDPVICDSLVQGRAMWVATHWETDAVPPAWATLQVSLERAVRYPNSMTATGGGTK